MKSRFNHIPFSPARSPFFYGWAILGVGTLGLVMTVPGQTNGFTPFVDDLIAALNLTRLQLTWAYAIGTIGSSLLLPVAGKLYDRIGPRILAPIACVGLGLSATWIAMSDRLAAVAAWGVSIPAFVVITLGFFGARFFGQGVLMMACRTMVMQWFDRHRGLAQGISGVTSTFGFAGMMPLLLWMNASCGWRGSYLIMAAIVGVVFAAVALLMFRDTPESCGLLPDGGPGPAGRRPAVEPVHRQFTAAEARRCYSFWVFVGPQVVFGAYMTGMMFHLKSIFAGTAMGDDQLSLFSLAAFGISVPFIVVGGWISDHIRLKYLLCVLNLGIAAHAAALLVLAPGRALWVLIAAHGVSTSMFGILSGVTWPRFFGRKHLGAITGTVFSITVFASALGPAMFSVAHWATDSYAPAAWGCLIAVALLAPMALKANNPQRRYADDATGSTGGDHSV